MKVAADAVTILEDGQALLRGARTQHLQSKGSLFCEACGQSSIDLVEPVDVVELPAQRQCAYDPVIGAQGHEDRGAHLGPAPDVRHRDRTGSSCMFSTVEAPHLENLSGDGVLEAHGAEIGHVHLRTGDRPNSQVFFLSRDDPGHVGGGDLSRTVGYQL